MANSPLWQKILVAALVVGVLTYFGWNHFIGPKLTVRDQLKKDLANVDIELRSMLPSDAATGPEGARLAADKIRSELDAVTQKLPYESDVPNILEQFIAAAGKGLKTLSYGLIEPQGILSEGNYRSLPIKLMLDAGYTDFNLYLMQLESLPVIIRVNSISIKTKAESSSLNYEMSVSAFTLPGTRPAGETIQPVILPTLYPAYYKSPFISGAANAAAPLPATANSWAQAPEIKLYGIWQGTKPRAFINDSLVSVGDKVAGFTVTGILTRSVTVAKYGAVKTLRLKE